MNLTYRSSEKELLDGENIPKKDLYRNLEELNFINSYLGGHQITIDGFKQLLGNRKEIHIAEIGCGGGDNLKAIYIWCTKNNVDVRLTGIDLKQDCINYAIESFKSIDNINFIVYDYRLADFGTHKPDIIFSSLFCHHLDNEQLKECIEWSMKNSKIGFFINDLHRHNLAYYTIKFLTAFFSKSYLVKNDAPVSVMRGFKRKDWEDIFESINMKVSIKWKWAFRYLIVFKHNES